MLRVSIVCVVILIFLNGCATIHNDNLERMQTLPQHYSQFDAVLAWEVNTSGASTVIDGVIRNIRYHEMNELEIWVSSLDAAGKDVHRTSDFIHSLKENETAQFRLTFPKVAPRTRLSFFYRYVGNEGGDDSSDVVKWSQSFESEVPGSPDLPSK